MKKILPLIIFIIALSIYYLSHINHPDWYKHFVYQADAFLHGRTDLQNLPDIYLDLIKYKDKIYIPNPPLPAIILMPFVSIWGIKTDEVRVSQLLGALNLVLVYMLLSKMKVYKWTKILLTTLFGFGTVFYSATVLGTIWFFAHIVAIAFILTALIEFFDKRRGFIIGLAMGLAALSRQTTILGSIFFLIMLREGKNAKKQILSYLLGLSIPLLFQAWFNFTRFGNHLESGYLLQNWYSSVQADDIAKYGFFNIAYLPKHLYIMFFKGPEFIDKFPFIKPHPEGMAIFLTTPAFLIAFLAPLKEKIVKVSFLTALAIALPALFYTATGWVQFGYRYTLDFLPFLFIPLSIAFAKNPSLAKIFLIFLSIAINTLGVYWAVKLGW